MRAPDAVVVDTQLSDGDGFRLAEELRRDPDTRDAPIFFIASSHRGASHRAEARRRFAPAEYLADAARREQPARRAAAGAAARGGTGAVAIARAAAPVDRSPDSRTSPTSSPRSTASCAIPSSSASAASVERGAKTLAGEKVELQGTLRRVPFARLLRRLYAQKATGSLLLLRDAAKKDATKKIVAVRRRLSGRR